MNRDSIASVGFCEVEYGGLQPVSSYLGKFQLATLATLGINADRGVQLPINRSNFD